MYEKEVQEYGRVVRNIAGRLRKARPTVAYEDLVQAGMVGLIEAAGRYDAKRGATFETFAGYRIKGAMYDYLRALDSVPRHIAEGLRDVARARKKISAAEHRPARHAELTQELGVTTEEYTQLVLSEPFRRPRALLPGVGPEPRVHPAWLPDTPEQVVEREELIARVLEALDSLPVSEATIIRLVHFEEPALTLAAAGATLGVTESRACQLRGQAIRRLRAALEVSS